MYEEGIIDILSFPVLSLEQRPQKLYVDYMIPPEIVETAHERGWEVVDIRGLPNATDGDRATAVQCHLQGIRQKTILPTDGAIRYIELEARIYGLLDSKQRDQSPETQLKDDELSALRGFSSKFSHGKLSIAGPKRHKFNG